MSYSSVVRETWRHSALGSARLEETLVRYATLAASSHNTQPWSFEIARESIAIVPDLTRRCPEVDPDDHHLFASLGCAAENLCLAARAAGRGAEATFDRERSAVRIALERGAADRSPLFEAIPSRQCSRTMYDGTPVPTEQLRLLERAGTGAGVSVLLLTDTEQKEQIAEFVAAGNNAQFADPRWAREMKKWIRFNAREALRSGDGLYGRAFGIPGVPRLLGTMLMSVAVSAAKQTRKDIPHIRSSGAIAVISSEVDDKEHWIEAGRLYERLALQAAALDLRTAFINQPVEVAALRPQLAHYLGLGDRRPDLIIRIGHGPEAPRSLRRPLGDVIVRPETRASASRRALGAPSLLEA